VLWTERSIMIGKAMTCIPYGMLFLLYLQCADALLYKKHRRDARKWALFIYASYILVLATVALGLGLKFSEMIFIDYRNIPGGPSAFYTAYYSYWIPVTSNSCFIALNLSAGALLLYRYFVIWQRRWYYLLVPALMFLAAIPIAALFEVLTVQSDSGTMPMGFAYWSLTIFFQHWSLGPYLCTPMVSTTEKPVATSRCTE